MNALDVLRSWAVQDSPPGAATAALVARVDDLPPGWLDRALAEREVVALYNTRTATAVVPADEVAAYATAQLPRASSPGDVEVTAVADALDGRELSRDDLHAALRERLPAELLPWCEGCQSHHTRRATLVKAGLHGRLCICGRAGRQPRFARTDQWVAWGAPPREKAGAELVRRYRRTYGPSSRAHFAQWTGLEPAHARELWELVPEDESADGPERLPGVRLLAAGDPILLGRDREALVPDPALRRKVWVAIGGAGIVTSDGTPVALWRARKRGKRLAVAVEAFGSVPRDAVVAQAVRLAPHRGCAGADVLFA